MTVGASVIHSHLLKVVQTLPTVCRQLSPKGP